MVKIRLARFGTKKRPFYQIVVINSKNARNGRFIEKIGFFNPINDNSKNKLFIKKNRIEYWISCGAQISNKVKFLIKKNNLINKQKDEI